MIYTYKKKWKPPLWLYILLFLTALYASLVVGYLWTAGEDTVFTFIGKLSKMFSEGKYIFSFLAAVKNVKPFLTAFFLFEFFVFFYILLDMTKQRNYLPDKEFGTSDWESIDKINRKFAEYADKKKTEYTKSNRIYSEGLRIGMNSNVTRINNNAVVMGGSGVGKTLFLLTPNVYQANTKSRFPGDYIYTDPKGEILLKNGQYFKDVGYEVKSVNLVPGQVTGKFNPFLYIRHESELLSLVNNILDNTTPPDVHPPDPFWEKAETLFYYSIFLLVWMEHDRFGWDMNFNTFLMLLDKAEAAGDDELSGLDIIFERLVADSDYGVNHPAYMAYKKVMKGPEETKSCLLMSIHARFAVFNTTEIRTLFSGDDLDLDLFGTGTDRGGKRKDVRRALFIQIPDSDTTYNCVAGMIYTLLFQQLYHNADFVYGGELPVAVTFYLDEFANIVMPKNFPKLLATMRSRFISCIIFIQTITDLKIIYKEGYEKIIGNCDVAVYLGGNEPSSFKYISENLGKKTIHKKSRGESRGHQPSTSSNDDTTGRELAFPEEVRELDNDYCIIFVRGRKPIFDHKYKTFESQGYKKSKELGVYIHQAEKARDEDIRIQEISGSEAEKLADNIIRINLDNSDLSIALKELDDIIADNEEADAAEAEAAREIDISEMSLSELLIHPDFTLDAEGLVEVEEGIKAGLTEDEIKSYILAGSAELMRERRITINSLKMLSGNH